MPTMTALLVPRGSPFHSCLGASEASANVPMMVGTMRRSRQPPSYAHPAAAVSPTKKPIASSILFAEHLPRPRAFQSRPFRSTHAAPNTNVPGPLLASMTRAPCWQAAAAAVMPERPSPITSTSNSSPRMAHLARLVEVVGCIKKFLAQAELFCLLPIRDPSLALPAVVEIRLQKLAGSSRGPFLILISGEHGFVATERALARAKPQPRASADVANGLHRHPSR